MSQRPWPRTALVAHSLALLCLTGGWLVTAAIAPPIAHAYVSRLNVTLEVQGEESYRAFISRAETVARAAIQRSFNRDLLISEVYVIITGQRRGSMVQVLSVQVSRQQWRDRPDPQYWATYYSSAKFLLGFGNAPATTATPARPASNASPTVIQTAPGTVAPTATPDDGLPFPLVGPSPTPPATTAPTPIPANPTTPANPAPPPVNSTTPLPPTGDR